MYILVLEDSYHKTAEILEHGTIEECKAEAIDFAQDMLDLAEDKLEWRINEKTKLPYTEFEDYPFFILDAKRAMGVLGNSVLMLLREI